MDFGKGHTRIPIPIESYAHPTYGQLSLILGVVHLEAQRTHHVGTLDTDLLLTKPSSFVGSS